jgi:hypothetical protein
MGIYISIFDRIIIGIYLVCVWHNFVQQLASTMFVLEVQGLLSVLT